MYHQRCRTEADNNRYRRPAVSQAGTVTFVPYDVRISRAGPRMLAAARTATTRLRLGADIVRLLDMV